MCLPGSMAIGLPENPPAENSVGSARTADPGSVDAYSMCGKVSGINPHGLSPVVSAECASWTPTKMLSRMGEATGTQFGPGLPLFQFQSYLEASISSPGPAAMY